MVLDKLATIRVPTLLMPGDQDLQCPPVPFPRYTKRFKSLRPFNRFAQFKLLSARFRLKGKPKNAIGASSSPRL